MKVGDKVRFDNGKGLVYDFVIDKTMWDNWLGFAVWGEGIPLEHRYMKGGGKNYHNSRFVKVIPPGTLIYQDKLSEFKFV